MLYTKETGNCEIHKNGVHRPHLKSFIVCFLKKAKPLTCYHPVHWMYFYSGWGGCFGAGDGMGGGMLHVTIFCYRISASAVL